MGNNITKEEESYDESSYSYSSSSDEEETLSRKKCKEYNFKVVIVGKADSGKTALVNRFAKYTFTESLKCEAEDVVVKDLYVDENVIVRVQIWDILPRIGYKAWFDDASGAIVVYDCTSPSIIDSTKWKTELDEIFNPAMPIPIVLAATKCDLPHDNDLSMDEFASKSGFIGRFETSAKLNTGINEAFEALVTQMYSNITNSHSPYESPIFPFSPKIKSPSLFSSPSFISSPSIVSTPSFASSPPSAVDNFPPLSPTIKIPADTQIPQKPHFISSTPIHSIPTSVVANLEKTEDEIYTL